MDKTEILARFDFYRRATPAQRTEFAAATESVRLPAGHAFYREGGAMAHVAFVGTGNIRVSKLAESGRELHLYHVRGGEACIVNMVCAYLHRPAVADARIEADTEAASSRPTRFAASCATPSRCASSCSPRSPAAWST
jgi:CRP/FNR family transcriptional regulator